MDRWTKTATGWVRGSWRIKGPIMGKPMFWLYRNGLRYTPTGKFDDAVSFATAAAAKQFVAQKEGE